MIRSEAGGRKLTRLHSILEFDAYPLSMTGGNAPSPSLPSQNVLYEDRGALEPPIHSPMQSTLQRSSRVPKGRQLVRCINAIYAEKFLGKRTASVIRLLVRGEGGSVGSWR